MRRGSLPTATVALSVKLPKPSSWKCMNVPSPPFSTRRLWRIGDVLEELSQLTHSG